MKTNKRKEYEPYPVKAKRTVKRKTQKLNKKSKLILKNLNYIVLP